MQFVENEKTKISGLIYHGTLADARQYQFQHHIVGQQDVWWLSQNALAFVVTFLSRVTSVGDR